MPRTRTYGLDVDTIAYAARVKAGSGVTILPEPLKQLNKFIVGIKKLGLWNSMVCWPMRSIHNAGRGSTLYGLGGVRVYNATLTNNANWSYNGINMSAVTSDNLSISNFIVSDLINGLNIIAYFIPSGSSPALTSNTNYFTVYYPSGNFPMFTYGHSGTGGTVNVMSNMYSNDGQRYFTGGANWSTLVRNQPICYSASLKKIFAISPTASITNQSNLLANVIRTSPNTLAIGPVNGDAACLLEFLIIIDNFDTVQNRLLIQNLYNKTLKTRQLYY